MSSNVFIIPMALPPVSPLLSITLLSVLSLLVSSSDFLFLDPLFLGPIAIKRQGWASFMIMLISEEWRFCSGQFKICIREGCWPISPGQWCKVWLSKVLYEGQNESFMHPSWHSQSEGVHAAATGDASCSAAKWPPVNRLTPQRFEILILLHIRVYTITTSVLIYTPVARYACISNHLPLALTVRTSVAVLVAATNASKSEERKSHLSTLAKLASTRAFLHMWFQRWVTWAGGVRGRARRFDISYLPCMQNGCNICVNEMPQYVLAELTPLAPASYSSLLSVGNLAHGANGR